MTDFRKEECNKKKDIQSRTVLQNREKRMLSNMVPHKLKIRKLTKGQKNEITMCFSSRYIYREEI